MDLEDSYYHFAFDASHAKSILQSLKSDYFEDSKPVIFIDENKDEYYILRPFSKSSDGGSLFFKAAYYFPDFNSVQYVAMRYSREFENLEEYGITPPRVTSRMLYNNEYYEYYGYNFPYGFVGRGSLLTLMANRFPLGLPEHYIVVFLYKTLQDLSTIHTVTGREISAAHVYVRLIDGYVSVNVGCEKAVQDLFVDQELNGDEYMPAASVSRWAAAPEVYGSSSEYGAEADVWLIGILALELAYGGLKLRSRDDLESLVRNIHEKKRLPTKLNRDGDHSWGKGKGKGKVRRVLHFLSQTLNPNKKVNSIGFEYRPKERVFYKGFVDLVVACLNPEPSKRPTVRDMLDYKMFRKWSHDRFVSIKL